MADGRFRRKATLFETGAECIGSDRLYQHHRPNSDIGPDERLRPVMCHFSLALRQPVPVQRKNALHGVHARGLEGGATGSSRPKISSQDGDVAILGFEHGATKLSRAKRLRADSIQFDLYPACLK